MKTGIKLLTLILLVGSWSFGQVKIGDNPQEIDAASVLELESNNRVLVITRVNNQQMNAITPLAGAMVYNTQSECIHYFDGAQWLNLCEALVTSSNISLTDNQDGTFTFTDALGTQTTFRNTVNTSLTLENNELVLTDSEGNTVSVGLEAFSTQTFTADGIINLNPTIVITENGTNFNFEVGQINGTNIVETAINGDFHIQDGSITTDKLQDNSIGIAQMQDNAVGSLEVQDGSLLPLDLASPGNDFILGTNGVGMVDWLPRASLSTVADGITITGNGDIVSPFQVATAILNDISDNTTNLANHIAADTDLDPTNELLFEGEIDLTTNALILREGSPGAPNEITVDITDLNNAIANAGEDNQQLNTNGNPGNISIENGNTISLNVNDADFDPANEIQNLTLSGNTLGITSGNTVTLPVADGSETIINSTATVTVAGNGTAANPYTLTSAGGADGSETIINDSPTITVAGNGTAANPYVLTSVGGGGNPNDELINTIVLNNTTLEITEGGNTQSADLSPLVQLADQITIVGDGSAGNEFEVADGSITSLKITDGTVNTIDLAIQAVTPANVAPSAILGQYLRTDPVSGNVIWDDLPAGTGGAVSSDGVTIIGDGAATDLQVPTGGITTTQLLNGTILPEDIAPGGADRILRTNATNTAVEWVDLPNTGGVTVVSADAPNSITAGTDGGALYVDPDDSATNELSDLQFNATTNILTLSNPLTATNEVDLSSLANTAITVVSADIPNSIVPGTDGGALYVDPDDNATNELTDLQFNATTNILTLSNPLTATNEVDLSSLANPAITVVSADVPNSISIGTDGGALYNDLDGDATNELLIEGDLDLGTSMLFIRDGDPLAPNEIQIDLSDLTDAINTAGSQLIVSADANNSIIPGTDGGAFYNDLDGNATNELADLQFNTTTNILTLSNPLTPGNEVDLSTLLTGGVTIVSADADNSITTGSDGGAFYDDGDSDASNELADLQFNTTTNILTLSNPLTPGNEVDLSTLLTGGVAIVSADANNSITNGSDGGAFYEDPDNDATNELADLQFDAATNILTLSNPATAGNEVNLSGLAISGTAGSVFFADTDGSVTENNAEFFWDNTNNRLGIGLTNPQNALDVDGQIRARNGFAATEGTAGQPSYGFFTNDDTDTGLFRAAEDQIGFSTGGTEAIRVDNVQNVAIGNGAPEARLHVEGSVRFDANGNPFGGTGDNGFIWDPTRRFGTGALFVGLDNDAGGPVQSDNVKVQFAEELPGEVVFPLQIQNISGGNTNGSSVGVAFAVQNNSAAAKGGLIYERTATFGRGDFHFLQNTTADDSNPDLPQSVMTITNAGDVGIGTTTPAAKLDVIGDIRGANIFSNGTQLNVPDYVFQKYYTGTSTLNAAYVVLNLSEVEAFIKENHHLPGLKSAAEIKNIGHIDLTESTLKNLEKIEELYLHTIQQEKEISTLKSENKALTNELKDIKNELEEIKALLTKKQ